ncbi:MAG: DNA repair exonuclease [Firmicutes bacterium]|nr:DNA repair exonuclease [Bacillota bacterium]
MFTFIHCADLHLDSPLRGLSARPDAPLEQIRGATRRALSNLVDLCLRDPVDFLVIAGDVYDGDWQDYSTGLYFSASMARLQSAGIPVFLIRGNHDAASSITRSLVLPSNVKEFSVRAPETYTIPELNVALHGQGFAQRVVDQNLALAYPDALPGFFNIGILHTGLEGQEGHEPYAPCRLDDLVAKGYDYWALGHIHKREVVHERPYVVYSGNLQGRHIRETGEKGCTRVTVDGTDVRLEPVWLDVLRWVLCEVDLTGVEDDLTFFASVCAAIDRVAATHPGYPLAMRVVCYGATRLHGRLLQESERYTAEVTNAAAHAVGDRLWIEKVKWTTTPPSQAAVESGQTDALHALLNTADACAQDREWIDEYVTEITKIQTRLGTPARDSGVAWVTGAEDVAPLLDDARQLLISLLQGGER